MDTNEKAIEMHKKWNGKLETISKTPVKTREDLSIAYTPGVAAPCRIIAENKEEAYTYTMKANTVAVVSDGSAVLGLGNIGETSDRTQPCRLWKENVYCLKNSEMSMLFQSALTHRIPKKL